MGLAMKPMRITATQSTRLAGLPWQPLLDLNGLESLFPNAARKKNEEKQLIFFRINLQKLAVSMKREDPVKA